MGLTDESVLVKQSLVIENAIIIIIAFSSVRSVLFQRARSSFVFTD